MQLQSVTPVVGDNSVKLFGKFDRVVRVSCAVECYRTTVGIP
jgi:hypothetical protein